MLSIVLFFIIAFIAAGVASIAGFGTATMLIPFASLVIDLKQAIVLVAFFHGFSNVFKLLQLRQAVAWRLFLLYGVPTVITSFLGAMLLERSSTDVIAVAFAAFIILFSLYSFLNPSWSLPEKDYILVSGGLLSGFTAGLIGVGGAIRGMFLISTRIRKEVYIATSAAIAVITDVTRVSVYIYNGSLEAGYYWYILPLIVIAFVGTWLGVRLLKRIPQMYVKRAVLAMLVAVGVKMLLESFGFF
jgi:uncharacterized membrane protein YfcA